MLRNAEAQINKSSAELEEADLHLHASKEEAQDLRERLGTAQGRLRDAEDLVSALQVGPHPESQTRIILV